MSKVEKIQLYIAKREPPQIADTAEILSGRGLVGDRHCMDSEKQISITGADIVGWMQQQGVPGLCFQKFSANLVLDTLEDELFEIGKLVAIGSAVVRITGMHKVCFFEECKLFCQGKDCKIQKGILFAQGVSGGAIRPGDCVSPLKTPSKDALL